MRRWLAIVLVLGLLAACAAGLWASRASLVGALVLPNGVDVNVTSRSFTALRVSYRVPTRTSEWQADIYKQLVAHDWQGRDYTFGVTRTFTLTWYTRTYSFGPIEILESAVVGGDPHDPSVVNIEVHRELHLSQ
jgi:hypothetical protein